MQKISIGLIIIAGLFATPSCTKNLSSELNQDPKSASTGQGGALFLYGEQQLALTYNTTSVAVAPFRVISQEWAENSYEYEADYNLAYYNSPGNFWNNLYVNTIHNLDLAKASFPVGFEGPAGQLRNDLDICDILEIYSYYMLVATYGNIPYSEAENVNIPFPKFDDAKTVYEDLLTRIDTCIAGLDPTQTAMSSSDQIYGGSVTAWVKFAASLKLKMAMLNAVNDPSTTQTKVNEAIGTGIFASDADDALMAYDGNNLSYTDPIWQAIFYSGRHDFGPAQLLINTMNGWNDPREQYYFTQYEGAYVGGAPGDPNNGYGGYSDFCCVANSTYLYSPTFPGDLLDFAEVEFYLTEAAAEGFITGGAGVAAAHYDSAVTSSIGYWGSYSGLTGAQAAALATTYLAQPGVAYSAANWQQIVGYQEYIANYNRNWDSWTDERRLGYPNINVVSPPQGAATSFPLRFTYPPNETTSNPTNTAAAVAALPGGIDALTAQLFWE
jgi:hypothetical protein